MVSGQAETIDRHFDHQLIPPTAPQQGRWRVGAEPLTFYLALANALAPLSRGFPSVTSQIGQYSLHLHGNNRHKNAVHGAEPYVPSETQIHTFL